MKDGRSPETNRIIEHRRISKVVLFSSEKCDVSPMGSIHKCGCCITNVETSLDYIVEKEHRIPRWLWECVLDPSSPLLICNYKVDTRNQRKQNCMALLLLTGIVKQRPHNYRSGIWEWMQINKVKAYSQFKYFSQSVAARRGWPVGRPYSQSYYEILEHSSITQPYESHIVWKRWAGYCFSSGSGNRKPA